MTLLTRRARVRWAAAQLRRALPVLRRLARLYIAALTAELRGHGDTGRTWRLRRAFSLLTIRVHEWERLAV